MTMPTSTHSIHARLAEADFVRHSLDAKCDFWTGTLSPPQLPTAAEREELWRSHPAEYHTILMRGRLVKTPRWQQAYGADYHYTGRVNKAIPLTPLLRRILEWGQETIDERLNGVLVNWYDARLRHYIGPHRDSTVSMIPGSPIVTISVGEERLFRLRPWRRKNAAPLDFPAPDGAVFVMPYETNLAFTHEVPYFARYRGRRISITLRAFESGSRDGGTS
jgi:alkylated DNA repair dioxygenase AlkB